MNRVALMGRLTDAPTITIAGTDMTVARFTIACERKFKKEGEPTADFINCVAFKKTAEILEKYVKKGAKILVEGSWQTGSYTNKNGNKVYTNTCVIESLEFCESKNSSTNAEQSTGSSVNGFDNLADDDDTPFL